MNMLFSVMIVLTGIGFGAAAFAADENNAVSGFTAADL